MGWKHVDVIPNKDGQKKQAVNTEKKKVKKAKKVHLVSV